MANGPRQRLIRSAIELVRERGVEGTAINDLLERSGSARQSIYQHFPGGKMELIDVSTRAAGEWMRRIIAQVGPDTGSRALIEMVVDEATKGLEATEFRLGCPVAAAATASDAPRVQDAAAAVFNDWSREVEVLLVREGKPPAEAASLATFVVSSVEGALLCSQAARSVAPLHSARDQLAALLPQPTEAAHG